MGPVEDRLVVDAQLAGAVHQAEHLRPRGTRGIHRGIALSTRAQTDCDRDLGAIGGHDARQLVVPVAQMRVAQFDVLRIRVAQKDHLGVRTGNAAELALAVRPDGRDRLVGGRATRIDAQDALVPPPVAPFGELAPGLVGRRGRSGLPARGVENFRLSLVPRLPLRLGADLAALHALEDAQSGRRLHAFGIQLLIDPGFPVVVGEEQVARRTRDVVVKKCRLGFGRAAPDLLLLAFALLRSTHDREIDVAEAHTGHQTDEPRGGVVVARQRRARKVQCDLAERGLLEDVVLRVFGLLSGVADLEHLVLVRAEAFLGPVQRDRDEASDGSREEDVRDLLGDDVGNPIGRPRLLLDAGPTRLGAQAQGVAARERQRRLGHAQPFGPIRNLHGQLVAIPRVDHGIAEPAHGIDLAQPARFLSRHREVVQIVGQFAVVGLPEDRRIDIEGGIGGKVAHDVDRTIVEADTVLGDHGNARTLEHAAPGCGLVEGALPPRATEQASWPDRLRRWNARDRPRPGRPRGTQRNDESVLSTGSSGQR